MLGALCSAPGELSSTWFVVLIVARLDVAGVVVRVAVRSARRLMSALANRVTRPSIPQPVRKTLVFSQRRVIFFKKIELSSHFQIGVLCYHKYSVACTV